jgi:zinc protease
MFTMIPLLAGAALSAEPVFPYPIHSASLDNGLAVHVVPMGTPGVASVYVWFSVGSRDEIDEGRTGFAHFFEHLAFYGTEATPGPEREKLLLRMGAEENAWTWLDETVYHVVIPAEQVPDYLDLQADVFQNLHLTPGDIQKESGAVYGEFRKGQASPGNAVGELLWATAFTTHTYGHDTIGYEADIQAMPTAHAYAMAFFDRYYRPENATVIIAGDVDPKATHAAVAKRFASWETGKLDRAEIPVEPEQTEARQAHLDWPTPTAARLAMAWKVPAADPTNPTVVALNMAAKILFSDVGPLTERLVREEGIAYSVWGSEGDNVDPSLFTIQVVLKDAAHIDRAEAIVREELAALQQLDNETLEHTRTHETYSSLTDLATPPRVASTIGWFTRRHTNPQGIDAFWAATAALTPDDIAKAAAETFVDARLTKATLSHTPEAK